MLKKDGQMKVKLLLGTATIALVSFVGAVYTVIGQEMPDSAPEPVFSVQSVEASIEDTEPATVEEVYTESVVEAQKRIPLEDYVTIEEAPVKHECPKPVDGSLNAQVEAIRACHMAE